MWSLNTFHIGVHPLSMHTSWIEYNPIQYGIGRGRGFVTVCRCMIYFAYTVRASWMRKKNVFTERDRYGWKPLTGTNALKWWKHLVIHLCSLTERIREKQTHTQEGAWTNGKKALIKSPRLSSLHCGHVPPRALLIKTATFPVPAKTQPLHLGSFRSSSDHRFCCSFVDYKHRCIKTDHEF